MQAMQTFLQDLVELGKWIFTVCHIDEQYTHPRTCCILTPAPSRVLMLLGQDLILGLMLKNVFPYTHALPHTGVIQPLDEPERECRGREQQQQQGGAQR